MAPQIEPRSCQPSTLVSVPDRDEHGGMVGLELRSALERTAHGAIERLAVDRLGVGQRSFAELTVEHDAQASILADDLRARAADPAMNGDEDGVGLLAQRIALQQPVGDNPGPSRIAGGETALGDDRQGVLEPVREAFPLGGEAIVTEASSRSPW